MEGGQEPGNDMNARWDRNRSAYKPATIRRESSLNGMRVSIPKKTPASVLLIIPRAFKVLDSVQPMAKTPSDNKHRNWFTA